MRSSILREIETLKGVTHAVVLTHDVDLLFVQGLVLRARFVAFGGGLPIVESGRLIGGIGVSGGSESQDETCARAGLDAAGLAAM